MDKLMVAGVMEGLPSNVHFEGLEMNIALAVSTMHDYL